MVFKLVGNPWRKKKGTTYYQFFRLAGERKKRVVSLKTKSITEARAVAPTVVEAAAKKAILAESSPLRPGLTLSIDELLDEYEGWMVSIGNSQAHITKTKRRLKRLFQEMKIEKAQDIAPVPLLRYLRCQVDGGNYRLATARHYRVAARAFSKWLWQHDYLDSDRLSRCDELKGDAVNSHPRAILSDEQIQLLLATTRKSKAVWRKLCGETRYYLYMLAVTTGLRAGELASLTPESFTLRRGAATVKVAASVSKRRTEDTLHLHDDLVAQLRAWLAEKPAGELLFPGTWRKHASQMLKRDLKAAGIPDVVKRDDGVVATVDFHAFRAKRVTDVVMTSAPLSVVMRAVRLSSPEMVERYAKISSNDVRSVVAQIAPPACLTNLK